MSRQRLTGKRAVWLGLFGTPVLLIAAIMLVGVTAGSAGQSSTAAPAATAQTASGVITHTTALGAGTQTLADLQAYWTPERMAAAQPYPMPTGSASASETASEPVSAPLNFVKMKADGTYETGSAPAPAATQTLTEPYHGDIPFSQWRYFAKYLPNTPGGGTNVAASAQHKMFFSQDGGSFVCSSSTIGIDGVWTAGHCVSDGAGTFSTNVFFCPSYDNGVNPAAGCWGAEALTVSNVWHASGDVDYDIGGADAADSGTVNAGLIGSFTGVLGFAYVGVAEGTNEAININYVSFGYPQGAPFNGNKIEICASSLGYVDPGTAGGQDSKAIGCDMTGGSSGGPWLISMGLPGQPGGGTPQFPVCCNFVFGHNDWRHTTPNEPNEMNSPPFNCLALFAFHAINDTAPPACP